MSDVINLRLAVEPELRIEIGYVGATGPAGSVGPMGPAGPGGAGFNYTQSLPILQWVIAHNLGYRPAVALFTAGGLAMVASILHLSPNVLQIDFSQPTAGLARLN